MRRRLVACAGSDRRASVALAWLLVPGASLVARRLRRLADVIDAVVAGQLRIQICDHDPADDPYVATTILRRVERESMASSAWASWLAKRRDPTWSRLVLVERYDESTPADEADDADDADDAEEPRHSWLSCSDVRSTQEHCPTRTATRSWICLSRRTSPMPRCPDAPMWRGRAGPTTPSVAQSVSEDHALAARTIRRHAADALADWGRLPAKGGLAL